MTELVIEGYLRSATTYCYYAFLLAQNRPVHVAYHLHVPAHVIRAVRWNIPTLVIIRDPRDAVSSALVRDPHTSVKAHLYRYLVFYQTLNAYRDDIVVADFEEVISDFSAVIDRINAKYATQFQRFEQTEENLARVHALLDARQNAFGGDHLTSYRPTAKKDIMKRKVDFSGKSNLLLRCTKIYRSLSPKF